MKRIALTLMLGSALAGLVGHVVAQDTDRSEWPTYGHDSNATRFSPLTQINTSNVGQISLAWTYEMRPENFSGAPSGRGGRGEVAPNAAQNGAQGGRGAVAPVRRAQSQVMPLVVNGVMYLTTPYRRIAAIDSATGKEIWSAEGQGSTRGLEYWRGDGTNPPEILFHGGPNANLNALNAQTGERVKSFGDNGVIGSPKGATSWTSPPIVYKNMVISQAANPNGDGRPEDIRAFDVVTGKQLWRFSTRPQKGEPNYGTWPEGIEGQTYTSGTSVGAWGFMTVDAARGIVYVPLDSPEWERWGGDRIGDNLYGDSIVAIDANTGKYLWHFQATHHDLWDLDLVGAPVLFDVKQDGKTIPAVGVIGKSGIMFILDRVTGKPVYHVKETPVAQSTSPGEKTSPTQPIPVKPVGVARTTMSKSEITTVTPELHDACTKLIDENNLGLGGPYNPPGFHRSTVNFPGANGSANYGGMAFDPTLGYLIVNTQDLGQITGLGLKGEPIQGSGGVRAGNSPSVPYDMAGLNGRFAVTINGVMMPCQEPPWGSLVAVNVNTGDIAWKVPLGVTESLPEGKQNTGRPNIGGGIATAGGVFFIAATDDSYFHAFDSKTGKLLWRTKLPVAAHSVPITYLAKDGKQYVVSSVGDQLFAYALP